MKFRTALDGMHPYEPPRMAWEIEVDRGSTEYVKLTMNELSFGPLPEAREAMVGALGRINRYPERDSSALREAIASANPGAAKENVFVGNGSSELLVDLFQIVERPGELVIPWPSFPFYLSSSRIVGLDGRRVELDENHAVDLDAMLAAVGPRTRAVILCNPNNPTGTYLPLDAVRGFAEALPEDLLLILDEAYYEFVADPAYSGSHALAMESENVVCLRTFSKVHGLAGLRVGYAIASPTLIYTLGRAHVPFSVNLVAQAAATASMLATEPIARRALSVAEQRERIQAGLDSADIGHVPSQTNFILARTGPEVFEKTGVLVREGEALGCPGWSRITVGNAEENDRLLAALPR